MNDVEARIEPTFLPFVFADSLLRSSRDFRVDAVAPLLVRVLNDDLDDFLPLT